MIMIRFKLKYFSLAVLLFLVELYIAMFVRDNFVRPYAGDFLVVILIYCFVMTFFRIHYLKAAMLVLVFSFLVEFLQYIHIVKWLGLENDPVSRIVIGSSFSWEDILAYVLGIITVIIFEKYSDDLIRRNPNPIQSDCDAPDTARNKN